MDSKYDDAVGFPSHVQPPCACGERVVFLAIRRRIGVVSVVGVAFFGLLTLALLAGGAPWFVTTLGALMALAGLSNMSRRDRDRYRLYRCSACRTRRKVPA